MLCQTVIRTHEEVRGLKRSSISFINFGHFAIHQERRLDNYIYSSLVYYMSRYIIQEC